MNATSMTRRRFLSTAVAGGGAVALPGCARRLGWLRGDEAADEVPATEDLMREHGVLDRLMLVYDEGARRLEGKRPTVALKTIAGAAGVVKRFIHEYHERLEESDVFPRFERANSLTDLVGLLRKQHDAGRRVTDEILQAANRGAARDGRRVAAACRRFNRMYRPHAAREDTVLFPALRRVVPAREYAAMGEAFEQREHQLFGEGGFRAIVAEVAGLENELGIYELAQFTP